MIIKIQGVYFDGTYRWPVEVSGEVKNPNTIAVKDMLTKVTNLLITSGITPPVTSVVNHAPAGAPAQVAYLPPPGGVPTQPSMIPLTEPPRCRYHDRPMRPSNRQDAPGSVLYYCSAKSNGGYCKERCKVDAVGNVEFWEAK